MGLLIRKNYDYDYNDDNNNNNKKEEGNPSPTRLLPAVLTTTTTRTAGGILPGDFEDYLKSQNRRNIRQILCYAQRYSNVLETRDASVIANLQSGTIRRHVMEALTTLSKYQGCYDRWQEIRKRYSLRWTNGDESLLAMQRFFDDKLTLDSMLDWVRQAIRVLPSAMGAVIKFATLVGLRPTEACESVRLLNIFHNCGRYEKSSSSSSPSSRIQEDGKIQYYNYDRQCLEHFRFPEIFLRQTKKAYISFITKEQLSAIGILGPRSGGITWNSIRLACRRRGINMNMHLCRKIFASHLRQSGIEPEIVDLLQGRVSQSVLVRNYLVPSKDLKDKVLTSLTKLLKQELTDNRR